MMFKEAFVGNRKHALLAMMLSLVLLMPFLVLAEDNGTVTNTPTNTLYDMISWFISTTGGLITGMTEGAYAWFGIDPAIFLLFLLFLFLMMIKYKANSWLFWGLLFVIIFLVASGLIPLGDYI